METQTQSAAMLVDDGSVQQMLLLAERLRASSGGELDDDSIVAVAEACSLPVEYVRATVGRLPDTPKRHGLIAKIRQAILTLDPGTRRHVATGVLATFFAFLNVVWVRFGDQVGLIGVGAMVLMAIAIWNFAVSRDGRTALVSGALFGGLFFVARSLFTLLFRSPDQIHSALIIPHVLLFGLGAFAIQYFVSKVRRQVSSKDPMTERQQLLQQLVELQDRLKSGEQAMSFLSLDVVGSTKMKQVADPLNVEYTFTEYHKWVDWVVQRYGGKVHSTAGDGITCAFHHPNNAYAAARYLQTGIVELNTFRNKIGMPIVLRAGIHYGVVNAPEGGDVTKINFASVIDIAAHMQKVAPAGGIAVSEAAAELVQGGPAAIGGESVEVSNTKGLVWQPRVSSSVPAPSGPPPLPT